jgi:hypothetical protein
MSHKSKLARKPGKAFPGPELSPLNDIGWKISRAQEHLNAVSEALDAFYSSDFYIVRVESNTHGRYIHRVVSVVAAPPSIGILIGEAAHQMRSVLDHLMWQLAGKPADEKEAAKVQFPIFTGRAQFYGWRKKTGGKYRGFDYMMPGVHPRVKTLVEGLQPYHYRKRPKTILLRQLQVISNWDKHRALMTAAAFVTDTDLNLRLTSKMGTVA